MNLIDVSELRLDVSHKKKGAMVFRALNNKLRQQMLQVIHVNGRMTVTNIYVKLRLEQSVASQHLAILRSERIVLTEKHGKLVFYSINYQRMKDICIIAEKIIKL